MGLMAGVTGTPHIHINIVISAVTGVAPAFPETESKGERKPAEHKPAERKPALPLVIGTPVKEMPSSRQGERPNGHQPTGGNGPVTQGIVMDYQ